MACACFTRNRQSSRSVRDAPGLFCQGCARSAPRGRRGPLPPVFSQVLILKGDKVVCFDTLLQVLILKVDRGAQREGIGSPQRHGGTERLGYPTPRVFCKKRLQVVENKGWQLKKERQEALRGRKRLRGRELRSSLGRRPIRFVRDGRRSGAETEEACGYTQGCGGREGPNGDTVS